MDADTTMGTLLANFLSQVEKLTNMGLAYHNIELVITPKIYITDEFTLIYKVKGARMADEFSFQKEDTVSDVATKLVSHILKAA